MESKIFKSERIFLEYLKSQGFKEIICQPIAFKLNKTSYRPDFYCRETDTYYEVINSRSTFYSKRKKMAKFRKLYPNIKFKIVNPSGTEYQGQYYKKAKTIKNLFSFWFDEKDLKKLKELSLKKDVSMGWLIRNAIRELIKKEN